MRVRTSEAPAAAAAAPWRKYAAVIELDGEPFMREGWTSMSAAEVLGLLSDEVFTSAAATVKIEVSL
jgi:hypothetical protein